jgi:hypothetical protein
VSPNIRLLCNNRIPNNIVCFWFEIKLLNKKSSFLQVSKSLILETSVPGPSFKVLPKKVTETPSKKVVESFPKKVDDIPVVDDLVVGHKMPKLSFQLLKESSSSATSLVSFIFILFVQVTFYRLYFRTLIRT